MGSATPRTHSGHAGLHLLLANPSQDVSRRPWRRRSGGLDEPDPQQRRPIGAMGTGIAYALEANIETGLRDVFDTLRRSKYLDGLSGSDFFPQLADSWGYLTQIHPFRDGNTRSQVAFIDRLAVRAGHPIDWTIIDVGELRDRRLHAITQPAALSEHLEAHEL